jgi:IPT/TIG domain
MFKRPMLLLFMLLAVTFAAAQRRPSANVQRQDAPTPEISSQTPNQLSPGQTATIVMRGKNFTADAHNAHSDGQCKMNSFKYVSPTEIQFNVTTEKIDDGGSCDLQVEMGGRSISNSVEIAMTALGKQHQQQREREEAERQQREAVEQQKQMAATQAHIHDIIGKKWDVKLPNGKSDTWTFSSNVYSLNQFKNSKGQELSIVVDENDGVVVQPAAGCMLTGTIQNGKIANGESPLPGCSLGNGAWSATISK